MRENGRRGPPGEEHARELPLQFPSFPPDKIPEDLEALEKILAGDLALDLFYQELERRLEGEPRFLMRLVRRDWQRNFRELRRESEAALRSAGWDGARIEPQPKEKEVVRLAQSLVGASPEEVLQAVSDFASRALLCHQMVPWVSHVKQVFDHFRSRLEAEDRHMAVLRLLADLLGDFPP